MADFMVFEVYKKKENKVVYGTRQLCIVTHGQFFVTLQSMMIPPSWQH
jgi:hypothetical protein